MLRGCAFIAASVVSGEACHEKLRVLRLDAGEEFRGTGSAQRRGGTPVMQEDDVLAVRLVGETSGPAHHTHPGSQLWMSQKS